MRDCLELHYDLWIPCHINWRWVIDRGDGGRVNRWSELTAFLWLEVHYDWAWVQWGQIYLLIWYFKNVYFDTPGYIVAEVVFLLELCIGISPCFRSRDSTFCFKEQYKPQTMCKKYLRKRPALDMMTLHLKSLCQPFKLSHTDRRLMVCLEVTDDNACQVKPWSICWFHSVEAYLRQYLCKVLPWQQNRQLKGRNTVGFTTVSEWIHAHRRIYKYVLAFICKLLFTKIFFNAHNNISYSI